MSIGAIRRLDTYGSSSTSAACKVDSLATASSRFFASVWQDKSNTQELVILWDDLSESVIEDQERLDSAIGMGYQLEVSRTPSEYIVAKEKAMREVYELLEEARKCLHADDVHGRHYEFEEDITRVMVAINYIEAMGMTP
jgi:hypothetical protein